MARKYSKSVQKEVKDEMHKYKRGKAHSGPKLKPVKSKKQAIAIALSKARKKGAKVPTKTGAVAKPKKTTSKPSSTARKSVKPKPRVKSTKKIASSKTKRTKKT